MSDYINKKAENIVERFKQSLNENIRNEISQSDYDRLSELIVAGMVEELSEVSTEIDMLAKKLRSTIEKPDMAL